MTESDQQEKKGKDESIDYGGSQSEIDKAKAKAREDDRKRLEEEHA
jgi:hypothetical protein